MSIVSSRLVLSTLGGKRLQCSTGHVHMNNDGIAIHVGLSALASPTLQDTPHLRPTPLPLPPPPPPPVGKRAMALEHTRIRT